MGKKKHNYRINPQPQNNPEPEPAKKRRLTTGKKLLIGLALIIVVVVAVSFSLSQSTPSNQTPDTQGGYPQNVAPVFYTTPTLDAGNAKVTVPVSFVNQSKLVFVDLKLQSPMQTLTYDGRDVPLSIYKNGEYLPLVLISTPSGNTVAGIRTCEPCGSFSFHIVQGTNLKCDACGTEWKLANFAPVSGGCTSYPPPKLSSTVTDGNIEVDLSDLQTQFT